jgi:hypothetical protein
MTCLPYLEFGLSVWRDLGGKNAPYPFQGKVLHYPLLVFQLPLKEVQGERQRRGRQGAGADSRESPGLGTAIFEEGEIMNHKCWAQHLATGLVSWRLWWLEHSWTWGNSEGRVGHRAREPQLLFPAGSLVLAARSGGVKDGCIMYKWDPSTSLIPC